MHFTFGSLFIAHGFKQIACMVCRVIYRVIALSCQTENYRVICYCYRFAAILFETPNPQVVLNLWLATNDRSSFGYFS